MGSSPRTKSEYLRAIQNEMEALEQAKNRVLQLKQNGDKQAATAYQVYVNSHKTKIAQLKLAMKSAPKD